MKNTTTFIQPRVSLKKFINYLIGNAQPMALSHQTHLVNEVSEDIMIDTGNEQLVAVIRELVAAVVTNSHHGRIHISAERFSDHVSIIIQERNNYNGYALAFSIGSIEQDAFQLGGHISINGPQKRVATISFSFPVSVQAA